MAEPCTRGGYADVCIDSADSGDAGHAADGHSSCATVYVYSVLTTITMYLCALVHYYPRIPKPPSIAHNFHSLLLTSVFPTIL